MISIDDQPISATFFGEGRWLTDFVTPDALEVRELYQKLTQNISQGEDEISACWDWVANQVRYKQFIKAKIWVEGKSSVQNDFWQTPSMIIKTHVGNCANKAFALCSLLRNLVSPDEVHVVLGNLTSDGVGGHAWCTMKFSNREYIIEATRDDVCPVLATDAEIYEPVVYFNDKDVNVIRGKTLKEPLGYCCVGWLKDYLDMRRCDEFVVR